MLKKIILNITLLVSLLFLSACSNWALREKCEQTNWFQYSQDVAFNGRYLEEDSFIKQCKGEDRVSAEQTDLGFKLGRQKMCQYPEIEKRGREGESVFFKFCDGLEMSLMHGRHKKGLLEFCTAKTAYPYGLSGKVYQRVCSAEQETVFMAPYRQGRAEYLKNLIEQINQEVVADQQVIVGMEETEARISRDYQSVQSSYHCRFKEVYDESSKTSSSKFICDETGYASSERSQFSSQLSEVRSKLSKQRQTLTDKLEKKSLAQTELDGMKTLTML